MGTLIMCSGGHAGLAASLQAACARCRPEAEAAAAPKLLPLLGLALGALLPTVLAVRLFVQLADAMSAVGPAAPPSSSAPPSGQEKESFGAFCLLVHLLGERPASLRGPDARALQWLLEGELEVCQ